MAKTKTPAHRKSNSGEDIGDEGLTSAISFLRNIGGDNDVATDEENLNIAVSILENAQKDGRRRVAAIKKAVALLGDVGGDNDVATDEAIINDAISILEDANRSSPRRNPEVGARQRNTHDPLKSASMFARDVRRADRDLVRAAEAGNAGNFESSLEYLLDVAFFLGRASCQREYATEGVSDEAKEEQRKVMERYTDMVQGRGTWASSFMKRARRSR